LIMACCALIRLCCFPLLASLRLQSVHCSHPLQNSLLFLVVHWCDSPSAAEEASRRLASVGFQKLSEKQEWKLKPGGRYYFTRNLSTIVAFAVGAKYQPGNGLHMIGAHTDR